MLPIYNGDKSLQEFSYKPDPPRGEYSAIPLPWRGGIFSRFSVIPFPEVVFSYL